MCLFQASEIPSTSIEISEAVLALRLFARQVALKLSFNEHSINTNFAFRKKSSYVPALPSHVDVFLKAMENDIYNEHNFFKSDLPSNLSSEEEAALKSIKNNSAIIVRPSDKGGPVVVLDSHYYFTSIHEMLNADAYTEVALPDIEQLIVRIHLSIRDCLNSGYNAKLNKFPVFNFNDDLKDLCISALSPNTTKATLYALNVWRYWCMTKGLKDYMDITKISAEKLNELLEDFYWSVKKTDGSDFLATSLHAIRRGLDRILKNAGVGFSITSSTFNSSTLKLKDKLRMLNKAGMSGARSRNIIYFSLSDEEEMWRSGCLGDDNPVALLSTVVKYNSQYFNMRTLQEHADLMYGDIELLKDAQNRPFFARTDAVKRGNRICSNKVCYGQIFHEHSKGHKRCPYCLLYKYMYSHRPPSQMFAVSPFYLTARKEISGMEVVWYEEQRMGLRSLRGVVPKLAKKVRLEHCDNFTFVSFTQASRKFIPSNSSQ
ncbi:uncharacterized protein KIAA1958-like [Protopterus annectens]|uniref:uncharacterized protein KIAA1958-like n=1 Tax=Protopterus annectens TaxID=7888 RepID=UPI001CF9D788|nr:uncharacterized protein KIAA1958-like [Protopterus annectens]